MQQPISAAEQYKVFCSTQENMLPHHHMNLATDPSFHV
jgi:hypothetical protein